MAEKELTIKLRVAAESSNQTEATKAVETLRKSQDQLSNAARRASIEQAKASKAVAESMANASAATRQQISNFKTLSDQTKTVVDHNREIELANERFAHQTARMMIGVTQMARSFALAAVAKESDAQAALQLIARYESVVQALGGVVNAGQAAIGMWRSYKTAAEAAAAARAASAAGSIASGAGAAAALPSAPVLAAAAAIATLGVVVVATTRELNGSAEAARKLAARMDLLTFKEHHSQRMNPYIDTVNEIRAKRHDLDARETHRANGLIGTALDTAVNQSALQHAETRAQEERNEIKRLEKAKAAGEVVAPSDELGAKQRLLTQLEKIQQLEESRAELLIKTANEQIDSQKEQLTLARDLAKEHLQNAELERRSRETEEQTAIRRLANAKPDEAMAINAAVKAVQEGRHISHEQGKLIRGFGGRYDDAAERAELQRAMQNDFTRLLMEKSIGTNMAKGFEGLMSLNLKAKNEMLVKLEGNAENIAGEITKEFEKKIRPLFKEQAEYLEEVAWGRFEKLREEFFQLRRDGKIRENTF